MQILSRAATSNPTRPEIPSIILTATQVMYTQVGPQGPTGPNDLGLQQVLINDSQLTQTNTINSGGNDLQFRNHTLFEVTQTQDINLSVTSINNIESNDGGGNISSLNLQGAQYDLKAQSGSGEYTSVYGTDNKLFLTTGGVYNGTVNVGDFLQLVGSGGQVEFTPISAITGPTGPTGPQGATGPTANLTFQQTLINGATLSQNNQVDLNNTNFTWNKPDRFVISGTSSTSGEVYTTSFNFRSASSNEVVGMSIVNQSGLTGSGIQVNRTSLQIRTPKVVNNTATVNQVLTLNNVNGQVEYKDVSTLIPSSNLLTYVTATNSTAYATSSTVALYSVLIPRNTVAGGDIINIQTRTTKVGTAAVYRTRMYANSTNNVSTATLLGDLLTTAATSVYAQFERVMAVKSSTGASNNQMFPTGTTNAFFDNAATTVTTTPTIDWTNDVYIMIAYTPVTGTADQIRGSFIRIEIEKGNV